MPGKRLTKKQMKIARIAGNRNKIDAADFRRLRNAKKKKKIKQKKNIIRLTVT